MSPTRVVRAEELPTVLEGSSAPVWWAILVVVAIESTVFATLISSYLYLRFTAPQWPPEGVPVPDLFLPILNTVVLFLSSVAVFIGSNGLKKGNLRRLKWGFGIGAGLEIAFLSVKVLMAIQAQFGWADHAYGSIYWTISRLHSVHVVVAIIMAVTAWVLSLRGFFSQENRLGIQVVNIYWQFVAIVWIPVFVILFLVPRWF